MEAFDYVITKIDGEYAYLKRVDSDDEIFIAMSLLPFGSDIGTKLHWENFEYTIL